MAERDDPDAPVLGRKPILAVGQFGVAFAQGIQSGGVNALLLKLVLDRLCTGLRQLEVVLRFPFAVSVSFDEKIQRL